MQEMFVLFFARTMVQRLKKLILFLASYDTQVGALPHPRWLRPQRQTYHAIAHRFHFPLDRLDLNLAVGLTQPVAVGVDALLAGLACAPHLVAFRHAGADSSHAAGFA